MIPLHFQLKEAQQEDDIADDHKSDRKKTEPHFINLNEDPMLSGVIYHFINQGDSTIGKKDKNDETWLPDICLSGHGYVNENGLS